MKKTIIFLSVILMSSVSSYAQLRYQENITTSANALINSPAFLDATSHNPGNHRHDTATIVGAGLVFPRVDLTTAAMPANAAYAAGTAASTRWRFDGMIVYNVGTGTALTGGSDVVPGFYYYENKTTTATASPTIGNNQGGIWKPLGGGKNTGWEVVGGNTVTTNHVQISNITRNVSIPDGAQIVIVDEHGVMSTIDIFSLCELCRPICETPATPGEMTFITPSTIDVGGTVTIMVPLVSDVTYIWVLPNGLSGSSNTNSITITGVNAGTYPAGSITVMAFNECGGSGVRTSTIDVVVNEIDDCDPPATPGAMTITPNPVNVGNNITATVPHVPGIVYAWTYPSSLTLVGSPIGNSVTFTTTIATTYPAGSISVKAISAECGESAAASASLVAVEVQNIPTLPCGGAVNIGGAVWACSNVDAPGTFAATSSSSGMFYQWNRRTAWAATGTVSGFPVNSHDTGTSWTAANDPCPTGWRVPTGTEIENLWAASRVYITSAQSNSLGLSPARAGYIFGTSSVPAAFNPAVHLFLPIADGRHFSSGNLIGQGWGYYWSSTVSSRTNESYYISFNSSGRGPVTPPTTTFRGNAFNVRCVKQ